MPNALARETSPYLRQHADNPVAWLPWGEEAFARARAEGKPVFLSIGYSTCHWCHVMAHESFEDPATARLLNEHFIPVKVDREERPDVDKVYMAYVQAMTGRGGWPLSAWLTPELKPFFGGTYFPPRDLPGRTGFPSLLQAIARSWRDDQAKLVAEADRVLGVLRAHQPAPAAEAAEGSLAEAAGQACEQGVRHFLEAFDAEQGGFGGAPKFPRPAGLAFLFRVAVWQGPDSDLGREVVRMATATLRAMARGGIHDHVGGGFHRYSVDAAWLVPHFEKMLYDQAQVAVNCLEALQATGDARFAWLARDLLDYGLRDLAHPAGGFCTAEDADSLPAGGGSHPVEGAFYVWTAAELRAALGEHAAFLLPHFGVAEEGNVPAELDPQGELRGKNILTQQRPLAAIARADGCSLEEANGRLVSALGLLREHRARRPRPLRDDKILAATNGLMISALARAHQVLGAAGAEPGDARYLAAATRAAEFLRRELWDEATGTLYRSWCGGRGASAGFAEDHAAVIQGLLDLYEAGFQVRWLQWADRLQARLDADFWDDEAGGYFNSRADDPSIVLRLKDDYDGAEPAASSVAAMNLFRLAAMLNDPARRERGRRCLEAFRARWTEAPQGLPQMLCALELALDPARHVVLAGDPGAPDFAALASVLHGPLGPRRILLAADGGEGGRWLAERSPWLAGMRPVDGRATAYVCEDHTCQAPVGDPEELRTLLGAARH